MWTTCDISIVVRQLNWIVPRNAKINSMVKWTGIEIRRNERGPTVKCRSFLVEHPARRKFIESIVIVVQCQANLPEIIPRLRPPCGFSSLLQSGQEQGDDQNDDTDGHARPDPSRELTGLVVIHERV